MTGPRERARGRRQLGRAAAPFYQNRLEVKAVNLHPNPMARAIRQTKSAPKLARDKRPLLSKLRPSEPQALALPRRYFSTPRSLRVLHPLPTHFLSFTSSPPSSGKSLPSFGLCPRAPRAGEPGPRLTRPHGPLLGPPSTPSVARLALAHAPRGLLLPAHADCDPCTLPPAVT